MAKKIQKQNRKNVSDPPPWLQPCMDNINKLGGTLCPDTVCQDPSLAPFMHSYCNCLPPFNQYPSGFCPNCSSTPMYIGGQNCFCCCGDSSYMTMIRTDKNKTKAIDLCKTAETIHAPTDATLKKWVKTKVNFVSQIGATGSKPQLMITFSVGSNQIKNLVVGNKQLLLMLDGKLKEAKRIVCGDKLMQSDGTAALVISVTAGKFTRLTTYLATSVAPASAPAGHLLVLNGIVAGDYALSLGIDPKYLSKDHKSLPVVGTPAYTKRYPASYAKKQLSAKKKR